MDHLPFDEGLFYCIRCGYDEESHQPNLVNESIDDPDFRWLEDIQHGFKMTILECMETPWPHEYKELVLTERLCWGHYSGVYSRFHIGYVSVNPVAEHAKWIGNGKYTHIQGGTVIITRFGGPVLMID
jgi:hypothetical protein